MNSLDWLLRSFDELGVDIPPAFADWLGRSEPQFGGWYLLDEPAARANWRSLNAELAVSDGSDPTRLHLSRVVLPFARRADRDDVACLVLCDPDHPRGSVLVIHEGAMPGYDVEEVIASVAQWFERAQAEALFPAGQSHKASFGRG